MSSSDILPARRKDTEGFRFELERVRYNLPLDRDISLDERCEAMYARVPPVVLEQAELYFETGEAHSLEHMRRLIRQHLREDVDEAVLRYHLSLNYDRLVSARDEFLGELKTAWKARKLKAAKRPEDASYQRIAESLTSILESAASAVENGDVAVGLREIHTLIQSAKTLRELDPAASKNALTDRVQAEREVKAIRESKEEKRIKDDMKRARGFQVEENAIDATDLIDRTNEVVRRIHEEGG